MGEDCREAAWMVTQQLSTVRMQAVITKSGFDEKTLGVLREANVTDQHIKQVMRISVSYIKTPVLLSSALFE